MRIWNLNAECAAAHAMQMGGGWQGIGEKRPDS